MKYLNILKEGVLWLPRKALKFFNFLLNKATEHYSAVCTGLGVSIIFLLCIFYIQLDNSAHRLKQLKENYELNLRVQYMTHELIDRDEFIDFSGKINDAQRKQLQEADRVIRMQENAIGQLIQKIRELQRAPSKKPIDPDKII